MNEYEPLTDLALVIQKLEVAVQKPVTDQVLSESFLDVITSRGGEDELELSPTSQVSLTIGYIRQIGPKPYKSVWLHIKPSESGYEGYEIINSRGSTQLYLNDFEANTQLEVSFTNTALRLRLLKLLLDGHRNTPFKRVPL